MPFERLKTPFTKTYGETPGCLRLREFHACPERSHRLGLHGLITPDNVVAEARGHAVIQEVQKG